MKVYDVIVIGGGHAGIEAASVAARSGCSAIMITMDPQATGRLSCNPSIGGSAKGHLVKEIDALGGVMGMIADRSGLQFKMLNRSKGPAVWSPRAQNDIHLYPTAAQTLLASYGNLSIVQGSVTEILTQGSKVTGVMVNHTETVLGKTVILCGGTFLNGVLHTGMESVKGGRVGEKSADKISDLLAAQGLEKGRLKTGTPPRIHADSVDYAQLVPNPGDPCPTPFSHRTKAVQNTLVCWNSSTSEHTHDILRKGFDQSPMFTGRIQGSGPRYCPSIEDKINRFADKNSHTIVLEPEGLNTKSVYVNGFSTSLPKDVQDEGIRTIPGLENAHILRYGYAVEYDFFFPYQLHFTMETKAIEGLFFAGQINGTSGYEEAACQGLIAGINAVAKVKGLDPFKLSRSEAYIGVLIDDLVNKSTEEPYRIFTSLAEYRLLLRQDNADRRLMRKGFELGLIEQAEYEKMYLREQKIEQTVEWARSTRVGQEAVGRYLDEIGEQPLVQHQTLALLARRASVSLSALLHSVGMPDLLSDIDQDILSDVLSQAEIELKYEGYIERMKKDVERFKANEDKVIPSAFDYSKVLSLSKEAREKLSKIQPHSLGQASRISGVSASDISVLTLYMRG